MTAQDQGSDVAALLFAALGEDCWRRAFPVTVPADVVVAAISEIRDLRTTVASHEARLTKQQDRISHLSRSNGALMVDRDCGIRQACEREAAALALTQEAAAKSGDAVTEQQVERRRAYDMHVLGLIDADRERLDVFRMGAVGAIQAVRERLADPRYAGREAELLGALIKSIEGHNDRCLKTPLPKWDGTAAKPAKSSESTLDSSSEPASDPVQPDLFEVA